MNEITQIARTVGPQWATPEYDRNGNMTVIPQPKSPTLPYRGTWDAWNRLVKLEEPNGSGGWQTLQENTYDGQTWRIIRKDYEDGSLSEIRHVFYTSQWQDIEERLGSGTNPNLQYAWGIRYINDLLCRDRDAEGAGSLDERLCALQDANWNVVAVLSPDESDSTVKRFAYTPYGKAFALSHSFISEEPAEWQIAFQGFQLDASGLIQCRFRFHDPNGGTWISRDEWAGWQNSKYWFEEGRPQVSADPYGLQSATIVPDYPEPTPLPPPIIYIELPFNKKPYTKIGASSVDCGTFTIFARRHPKNRWLAQVQIIFSQKCKASDPQLPDKCCCDKIMFIQAVNVTQAGKQHIPADSRPVKGAPYTNWLIDRRYSLGTSPYWEEGADAPGQIGSTSPCKRTILNDEPGYTFSPLKGDLKFDAVSCVYCAKGLARGKCMGCVSWKFHLEDQGSFSPYRFRVSMGSTSNVPPAQFGAALAALAAGYPDTFPDELR